MKTDRADPGPGDRAHGGSIAPDVLGALRCPNTLQPLEARAVGGALMLVTLDGRWGYPVRDGVPILLPDAAVALDAAPTKE